MLSLLSTRNISLVLSLLLLTGCAEFDSGWGGYSNRYNDSYTRRGVKTPKKSSAHKQKTVQSMPESKNTNGSKKDETRLLREKLEAIRSMEKHLDETSDTK
jgi:hypothetical protein